MKQTKQNKEMEDNLAGADIMPPPKRVNSLQSIMKLRPISGGEWSTIAFVLNRDMIKPDGSLDELHAVVFPLGSFGDQHKAEKHAKRVIEITGHPGVVVARYGCPFPLTTHFDPANVSEVALDSKGRIFELESAKYKKEKEEYENRAKIERAIMKEAEEETDPDNIEHFKRQCYLAIKNRSSYQVHSREADTAWQNYKKREMAVRDHYARHPEHEAKWLEFLREKLTERGELDLYKGIEVAYKEIREELLGLLDSSDEEELEKSDAKDNTIPNTSEIDSSNSDDSRDSEVKIIECNSETSSEDCEGGICIASKDTLTATPTSNDSDDDMIEPENIPVEIVQQDEESFDSGFVDEDETTPVLTNRRKRN